jgi:hypothetical protein
MAISNIEVEKVDDWDNLRYTVNKYFAHWPEYIFRGQAQDNWPLESNLTRALRKIKSTDKEYIVTEHLRRFKLEIRGRRGDNPRGLDENETWALGQHFGLYTPLIDWTESPWVAIFFALTGSEKSETGYRALWALHTPDIESINVAYKDKGLTNHIVELVEPIIDENSRLVNQRGLFTKIHFDNDIEKWVANAPDLGPWVTLYKIIFPDSLRQRAMLYLNLMNVNHSSLFPDLYGSSKFTNQKLLLTDYLDELKEKDINGTIEHEE